MMFAPRDHGGPVDLPLDAVIGGPLQWEVRRKLGEGGYGSVFEAREQTSRVRAAIKAERTVLDGSVLKIELQVLKRLRGRPHVPQVLDRGLTVEYTYIAMTLLGPSLCELFKKCGHEFSVSTQLRVGMQVLYGLKQLHEVGFIHRDVKPANLAIGRKDEPARIVHLLDFGMAREFVLRHSGRVELRPPRARVLYRGTPLYSSPDALAGIEQGRHDDLWSLMYVLAEMRCPLPWDKKRPRRIGWGKKPNADEDLFQRSPPALHKMAAYLRTLDYAKRPDYALLFDLLLKEMLENNIKYSEPFDWEKKIAGLKIPKQRTRTVAGKDAPSEGDLPPFTAADLAKNELGF